MRRYAPSILAPITKGSSSEDELGEVSEGQQGGWGQRKSITNAFLEDKEEDSFEGGSWGEWNNASME
jgi:hypothetical protein